jgi:hypothetical protein
MTRRTIIAAFAGQVSTRTLLTRDVLFDQLDER